MKTSFFFFLSLFLFTTATYAGVTIGNPEATIEIIDIYSYDCLPCRMMYPEIVDLTNRNPRIKVLMHNMPSTKKSYTLAAIAEYINKKYPDKISAFFEASMKGRPPKKIFMGDLFIAAKMSDDQISDIRNNIDKITQDFALSRDAKYDNDNKITSVPTLIINNKIYPGFKRSAEIESIVIAEYTR